LISAALSQVSLVSGRGSSWSQPLLAYRPSRTEASGRKTLCTPCVAAVERAFPGLLVGSQNASRLPVIAHDVVAGPLRLARERGQDLVRGLAARVEQGGEGRDARERCGVR